VEDIEPFLENDAWLEQFDEVVAFQKEGFYYQYKDTYIPTRLVIYQNSRRVDFSLWPIWILVDWIATDELPEFYKNGYEVLLDKFGFTTKLINPTFDGYLLNKPTADKFLQTIFNFYFEAAIIAKYLYRKNLWFACKLSSGSIKDFLQQMIMWQAAEKESWNLKGLNTLGKNLEEKISSELIGKLNRTFSSYDINSCWQSLFAMIDLFNEISKEVSEKLEIEYPKEKIENISEYIKKIHSRHIAPAS
jgi:aminoglycoside 6-adenylyltransferase